MPAPYTPPTGNVVNFNFTVNAYVVPTGNVVNFNFGVDIPGGVAPSGAANFLFAA